MIAAARVASAVIPRAATSARPAGTFLVATGACLPAALPRRGMSAAAAASPPWVTPGGQLGVDEDEDYIVFPRQRPGAFSPRVGGPSTRAETLVAPTR